MRVLFSLYLLLSSLFANQGISPQELAKKQCRSVHLAFEHKPALALYNEITVQQSQLGTYFCALGYNRGYFGMQTLLDGRKIILFSTWDDAHGDNPHAVAIAKQVQVLDKGDQVITSRFGGEGTGVKSYCLYPWKEGSPVKFFVCAKSHEENGVAYTDFSGYFFDERIQQWHLMTTLRTPLRSGDLRQAYSFVEDFARNYTSATLMRKATFSHTQAYINGAWLPLLKARFTADYTPSSHIDAGATPSGFFLQTGGNTEMKTSQLWQVMERKLEKKVTPPSLSQIEK